jgi:hypothetical protein
MRTLIAAIIVLTSGFGMGLVLSGVYIDKCFPKVIAEVCSILVEIAGPCCRLRPWCRYDAYITPGNAYKLGRFNGPKGGLLNVLFLLKFQKFSTRCL